MGIKDQLRAARNPATFIECALKAAKDKKDPFVIVPEHFEQITGMIFADISVGSAKEFKALHTLANRPDQGARLIAPFYRAAQNGFGSVGLGQHMDQCWGQFFSEVASTIRGDSKLTAIVNRETVRKQLPSMIWSIDQSDTSIETATGIINALGNIPEAIAGLDPDLVTALVNHHIKHEGSRITAAPKLTELRAIEPFREAIIKDEDTQGLHVVACQATIKHSEDYSDIATFVIEFNRRADDIRVFRLDLRRRQWQATILKDEEDGTCRAHGDIVADLLVDYSLKPLKGQEWVKPIAERIAFEIA